METILKPDQNKPQSFSSRALYRIAVKGAENCHRKYADTCKSIPENLNIYVYVLSAISCELPQYCVGFRYIDSPWMAQ